MRQLAAVGLCMWAGCWGATYHFPANELRKLDGYTTKREPPTLTSSSGDEVEITRYFRLAWHLPREARWPWTKEDDKVMVGGRLETAKLEGNGLVVTMSDGQSMRLDLGEVRRMEATNDPSPATKKSHLAAAIVAPIVVIATIAVVVGTASHFCCGN